MKRQAFCKKQTSAGGAAVGIIIIIIILILGGIYIWQTSVKKELSPEEELLRGIEDQEVLEGIEDIEGDLEISDFDELDPGIDELDLEIDDELGI